MPITDPLEAALPARGLVRLRDAETGLTRVFDAGGPRLPRRVAEARPPVPRPGRGLPRRRRRLRSRSRPTPLTNARSSASSRSASGGGRPAGEARSSSSASLLAPALASIAAARRRAGDRRSGLLPATIPPPIVVTSTADRTTAAVGERVTVVYSARIPEGAALKLESLVSPARPEGQSATAGFVLDFEPVEPLAVEKEKRPGLVDVRQTVRLAAFVPGETRIPGPVFSYEGPDGAKAVVRPPEVTLTVSSRLPADQEPEQVAPKPERPVRIPGRGPWFWASIAAALLAVAGLVFWLVKRRKKKGAAVEENAPPPRRPTSSWRPPSRHSPPGPRRSTATRAPSTRS